jgi:hypothetical protein
MRKVLLPLVLMLVCGVAFGADTAAKPAANRAPAAKAKQPAKPRPKYKEITDPAEARKDPDFGLQGEYLSVAGPKKMGAQVIALGKGEFSVVVYVGGLPGEGWLRGGERVALNGKRQNSAIVLTSANGGDSWQGKLTAGPSLTLTGGAKGTLTLRRVERRSPTLGQKAPAGAMVLFNGTGTAGFPDGHMSPDGNLWSGCTSKPVPNSYKLHLEFRMSYMPDARGQARSNSGVYVHDSNEIQVLDSFGLEGRNNECCGFYSIKEPAVNMCLPPLTWQTYDIDFTGPKYDAKGTKIANARITVVLVMCAT